MKSYREFHESYSNASERNTVTEGRKIARKIINAHRDLFTKLADA